MTKNCEICDQNAHGFHFGAQTCRACAAFFKRAVLSKKRRRPCKYRNSCVIFDGESFQCKSCRLKKCLKAGMSGENLAVQNSQNVTICVEKFVGRPALVIFCDKSPKRRTFVDLKSLVTRAARALDSGAPTVIRCSSHLEKLSLALRGSLSNSNYREMEKIGRGEVAHLWESEFLTAATWLTHFDEFRKLPKGIQMQLLQSVWHVFGRLVKVVQTGVLRRKLENYAKNDVWVCDDSFFRLEMSKVDLSWITVYPVECILYFIDFIDGKWQLEQYVDDVARLELSEIELTYMMAQLCFQYAGNRYSGQIREVTDRFQEMLADELHLYYVGDKRKDANYAGRLTAILKVNQGIQHSIRQLREKTHIAHTFDIFTADFSHPEMFFDTGC